MLKAVPYFFSSERAVGYNSHERLVRQEEIVKDEMGRREEEKLSDGGLGASFL